LSKISPENLLLVGKVIRPHGLDGSLRIRSYAQSAESFLDAGNVFLKSDKDEMRECKISSIRPHKGVFLIRLQGLQSLEEAEGYRGAEIFIRKDLLEQKCEEEYFWFELIGLEVFLNSGRYLGKLTDIIPTGSNDIYVVKEGGKEVLIPAIHEVVDEIDLENKRIIITEMEGLLSLNEV
jgi:16S rRNA processing protein RimM